ncbi:universal stress protein [Variovorax ginsengisoli]|uniref:Universal stress protein n=1 Tax=Variovorax ginsengisoli TaxID=363844 RepID=A0ABT8SHZ6_9BURK|nr:universal stress protein [Variovorax ginsengisoli]MDN8618467.1 universal stress protein [Variovorax ginsengisoli]MDO1537637.1 universal stress protein [Variovorax ginsengisoli]
MFQHILVATDGTSFCDRAMNSAIELAFERNADVVALRVVPRYAMNYFDGVVAFSPEEIASAEARSVSQAEGGLQSMVARAEASGIHLTTSIAVSDGVADAIIAAANKHGSDLIVMASHRRSGFARLLIGSDTDQVLAHSKVPVLVIR